MNLRRMVDTACITSNWDLVEKILEACLNTGGIDLHHKAQRNVFFLAVQHGRTNWLTMIVPHFVTLEPGCSLCQGALAMAAEFHQSEMIDHFLANGFDVNMEHQRGHSTLLSLAVTSSTLDSLSTIKVILDRGADINAITSHRRYTALSKVAENGFEKL